MKNILAEFDVGRDDRGIKRKVEWVDNGQYITLQVVKNGKPSTKINWDVDILEDLFSSMIDVREEVREQPNYSSITDTGFETRARTFKQLLNSFSDAEIERLQSKDLVNDDGREKLLDVAASQNSKSRGQHNEKIKEDVLQLIYQEYGFEWFTLPEFRQVYDINFEKSEAYRYLQKLHDRWIRKDTIPEEEREGQVKYRYKLNSSSEKVIQQYGAFDTMDYPVYRKKSREYKN